MSEITQTQVKSFYKNGFLVLKNIIPKDILIQAKHNDIILFSPGTSSFDQFKSYIERGNSFNSYVRQFT